MTATESLKNNLKEAVASLEDLTLDCDDPIVQSQVDNHLLEAISSILDILFLVGDDGDE